MLNTCISKFIWCLCLVFFFFSTTSLVFNVCLRWYSNECDKCFLNQQHSIFFILVLVFVFVLCLNMIKFAVTRRFEGYGCLVLMYCHLGMCSFRRLICYRWDGDLGLFQNSLFSGKKKLKATWILQWKS